MNAAHDLAATGTPGPWRLSLGASGTNWIDAGDYDEVLAPAPAECMAYCYGGSSRIDLSDADAAKIVTTVNALEPLGDLLDATDAMIAACEARAGTKTWAAHKERKALSAARDAVVAALGGAS